MERSARGRFLPQGRTHCPQGHPYAGENVFINKAGRQVCRECTRAQTRESLRRIRQANPSYASWASMKTRCLNPNAEAYPHYGGRGITVCERWLVFANFDADMGPRPSKGHSLERINNDGNYEPGNVKWATHAEQTRNTRRTKLSPVAVMCIKVLRERGAKLSVLAQAFGVCEGTIGHVAKGRHWR